MEVHRLYIVLSTIFILSCFDAQLFVNINSNGDKSSLQSIDNYTALNSYLSANLTRVKTQLRILSQRWEKELATEKKSLLDLKYLIADKRQDTLQPSSCAQALRGGKPNGVYKLYMPVDGEMLSFDIYCLSDPNHGDAWTIIQRRQDGSENFYRGWHDYRRGFGSLNNEFWIGLDNLHTLTNYEEQELWIQLQDFSGRSAYAKYQSFAIGNEKSLYELIVLGEYSGNATDSLNYHRGRKFTTHDNDNDINVKENCAKKFTGAWWYGKCLDSNLNGRYLRGPEKKDKGQGIEWANWKMDYSMKYVHLALRPI